MTPVGMRKSEADRQKRITDALELCGWLWVHYRTSVDPRRGGAFRTALDGHKGAPDLIAVHPERGILLFVEVKRTGGKLSPEQEQWIDALENVIVPIGKGVCVMACDVMVCDSDESEAELLALITGGRVLA